MKTFKGLSIPRGKGRRKVKKCNDAMFREDCRDLSCTNCLFILLYSFGSKASGNDFISRSKTCQGSIYKFYDFINKQSLNKFI